MATRTRGLILCLLLASMLTGLLLPAAHAFTTDMNANLVIGEPDFNTNSGGVTTRNGLYYPGGTAFDSLGDLWVADTSNNRVLEFTPPFINGKDAILVLGQPNFTANAPDIYPLAQNGFNEPNAVAFDSSGNLWVSVFNDDRVLEFKPPFTTNMNASLVIGQLSFMDQCPCTTQYELNGPDGITFDRSGNLWVADDVNNRVLEFKPPFSNGMNAALVIGQHDFTHMVQRTTRYGLDRPTDVAFDSSGDLWVSDINNNRVMMFEPPFSNEMNATLVIGQTNFTSMGSAMSQSGFNSPEGLGFDASGNLWVVDMNQYRVLRFSPPFSTGMNANLVLGQPDFNTFTRSTSQNGFLGPNAVTFDSLGDLWVTDGSSHRVLEFSGPAGLTSSALELQAGWNLVSLSVVPANSLITQLLAGLIQYNELVTVWGYSASATPAWSSFTPPNSGTLKNMVDGLGYWVNVRVTVNMTVAGYVIPLASPPPAYKLTTGWNLAGYKPQPDPTMNETVSTYLSSINGDYNVNSVWIYDNLNATWTRAAAGTMIAPGEAMWIYVTTPTGPTLRP